MKQSIEELTAILHRESCSCVVGGDEVYIGRRPGVADLYMLYKQQPKRLRGQLVADKVVGKAAATLMILGGVAGVYADLMSRLGAEWLDAHGVKHDAAQAVDHIVNRTNTGWCPLEQACLPARNLDEALVAIETFLEKQTIKNK